MRINGKLNSSQQFHLNLLAGTFLFSSATSHAFPSKVKRYLMVMVPYPKKKDLNIFTKRLLRDLQQTQHAVICLWSGCCVSREP